MSPWTEGAPFAGTFCDQLARTFPHPDAENLQASKVVELRIRVSMRSHGFRYYVSSEVFVVFAGRRAVWTQNISMLSTMVYKLSKSDGLQM